MVFTRWDIFIYFCQSEFLFIRYKCLIFWYILFLSVTLELFNKFKLSVILQCDSILLQGNNMQDDYLMVLTCKLFIYLYIYVRMFTSQWKSYGGISFCLKPQSIAFSSNWVCQAICIEFLIWVQHILISGTKDTERSIWHHPHRASC